MEGIRKDERICVVGAGAAGISAAVYLRDAGYSKITILEREDHVGGKCRTWREQGRQASGGSAQDENWELGAILGATDYKHTISLMRRVGIKPWRYKGPARPYDPSYPKDGVWPINTMFPGWVKPSELLPILWQMARYHLLAPRWKKVFDAGHRGVPEELAAPFSEWVKRYRMQGLAKIMAIPFTTFGYGYYDEIPAAYVLKFFEPGLVRALAMGWKFFNWKEGIQTLWQRLAEGFDLRLGVKISSIRRSGRVRVKLESGTGSEELEFDRLILACPLDDALTFLDASAEEKELYGKIRYMDYRVYLSRASGLKVPAGFIPARFDQSGLGKPMIWDQRVRGVGMHTFYILGNWKLTEAQIDALVEADIAALGGKLEKHEIKETWKYFPHLDQADYRDSWYQRFEDLQGKNRCYVTGEIASFSTVERVVRYPKDLVRRFFT